MNPPKLHRKSHCHALQSESSLTLSETKFKKEALEKCKQDVGVCVMVMFVVDLLIRKEGRIILPFKTGRSTESRKAQQLQPIRVP